MPEISKKYFNKTIELSHLFWQINNFQLYAKNNE
jgi:hypothetical protein